MICIPMKKNDISNIIFHLALKVLKKKNCLRLRSYIFWLKLIFHLHFGPHASGQALDGAGNDASPLANRF